MKNQRSIILPRVPDTQDVAVRKWMIDVLLILQKLQEDLYDDLNSIEVGAPAGYTHPNHSGEVTSVGDGAQTIANKITMTATSPMVVSNAPTVIAAGAVAISIPAATAAAAGHATAAQITKLDGIATGANLYVHPNHTGDVTSIADGAQTIAANSVTLAKLATQAADTVLANVTAGAAVPTAVTMAAQTVLGRLTGGHVDDIVIGIADNNMVQIDSASVADDEYARFTAGGLESRSVSEVATDIAGQFTSDIITTADLIATDVYIGSNAAATDPTLNFITSGNDATITYDQANNQLQTTCSWLFSGTIIHPWYTLINPILTTAPSTAIVSLIPDYTPPAGAPASSLTALGGYNLVHGADTWAVGSVIKGLDYGNSSAFVWGGPEIGSPNITAIGIDCFGMGSLGSPFTVGTAIGLRACFDSFLFTGNVTATNAYGIKIEDAGGGSATVTNQYGLVIELPTKGTNKYQVVLNGNGAGSGIWFDGITGERIYSDGTNINIGNLVSSGITLNIPTTNQSIGTGQSAMVGRYYTLSGTISLTISGTGFMIIHE